jgi:chromosome segregation ATPase
METNEAKNVVRQFKNWLSVAEKLEGVVDQVARWKQEESELASALQDLRQRAEAERGQYEEISEKLKALKAEFRKVRQDSEREARRADEAVKQAVAEAEERAAAAEAKAQERVTKAQGDAEKAVAEAKAQAKARIDEIRERVSDRERALKNMLGDLLK